MIGVTFSTMRYLLIIFLSITCLATKAQVMSDFITVKKKNNRTVKTYMPGNAISFVTVFGYSYDGWITAIRNDSVFLKIYDIRTMPTQFGTSTVDTVGSFSPGLPFKDIFKININKKQSFGFIKQGTALIIGGLGYAALNIINGAYLNEPLTDKKNLTSLGIAMAVAGTGFILNKTSRNKLKRNPYKIIYVHMNNEQIKKLRRGF
jgi:hypothetical protein